MGFEIGRSGFADSIVPTQTKTSKVTYGDTSAGAYYIGTYENIVEVDSTDGAITLYLPSVGEAKDRVYVIYVDAYTNGITITDHDSDSQDFPSITIDGADDGVVLWSDGTRWWVLAQRT